MFVIGKAQLEGADNQTASTRLARNRSFPCGSARGFTLIELLVVMAVVAILAAMLLPTLAKARTKAQSVRCLNNLKQLQVCSASYAADFSDFLPPNNSISSLPSGATIAQGLSWSTNFARYDAHPMGIQYGLLYEYNTSVEIYSCPSDYSVVETPSGQKLTTGRWRSYNLSQSINGAPDPNSWTSSYLPSFKKLSEVSNPGPSALLTFIEVHEDSIYDAVFGIPTKAYGSHGGKVWWDIPANRHGQGATFSFADGHAEVWRWKVAKTVHQRFAAQAVPAEEIPDYNRVQAGVRQTWE